MQASKLLPLRHTRLFFAALRTWPSSCSFRGSVGGPALPSSGQGRIPYRRAPTDFPKNPVPSLRAQASSQACPWQNGPYAAKASTGGRSNGPLLPGLSGASRLNQNAGVAVTLQGVAASED